MSKYRVCELSAAALDSRLIPPWKLWRSDSFQPLSRVQLLLPAWVGLCGWDRIGSSLGFSMWETWVQSLGWEDPLEKGKATHSSILAWRIYSPWGCKESDTTERFPLNT